MPWMDDMLQKRALQGQNEVLYGVQITRRQLNGDISNGLKHNFICRYELQTGEITIISEIL